eukprot:6682481-Pyramimonas_sp.AAC.1
MHMRLQLAERRGLPTSSARSISTTPIHLNGATGTWARAASSAPRTSITLAVSVAPIGCLSA